MLRRGLSIAGTESARAFLSANKIKIRESQNITLQIYPPNPILETIMGLQMPFYSVSKAGHQMSVSWYARSAGAQQTLSTDFLKSSVGDAEIVSYYLGYSAIRHGSNL